MKKYLFGITLLTTTLSFGQNDSLKNLTPRFEAKLTVGGTSSVNFYQSVDNWNKTTPMYVVPDSFSLSNENMNFFTMGANTGLMLSFSIVNNYNKKQRLCSKTTFHFGFGPQISAFQKWNHKTVKTIDTLVSSVSGNSYYINEVRENVYQKRYTSSSIVLGIGQRISTSPNKIFRFETGIDIMYFTSFNSTYGIVWGENVSLENTLNSPTLGSHYPQQESGTYTGTSVQGHNVSGMIIRLPLDFSFKLGHKVNILKDMRLGWEFDPGVNFLFTKGRTLSNNYNFLTAINLRYHF